jgi:sugar/nucleoside kinase (ribokinase family)
MKRILVAGELNVDLVMSGLPSLPVLGRELTGTGFSVAMGSSSAITAARLAVLGAAVDFIGIVGEDDFGQLVLRELKRYGVGIDHIGRGTTQTGVTIALTYRQDRALLTYPGTIAAYDGQNITAALLAQYDHLHVGSFYLQTGLQAALPDVYKMAREAGLTTSLDAGWDPLEDWSANPFLEPTLAQTDYFLPNESEATALIGANNRFESLAAKVDGLLVVKRGAEGATAFDKHGEIVSIPALPVKVIDTTGAGDAFNAGFIYARRIEGAGVPDALRFGAACGAQAVARIGGATDAPSASAVKQLLQQTEVQS